jgi:hypothetical protein
MSEPDSTATGRTLSVVALLIVVSAGAWFFGQGPESSYWSLRKYARKHDGAHAIRFVDRRGLEEGLSRESGRPVLLYMADPLHLPGVALGTALECDPVADLLDGLGPGLPFVTRPCNDDTGPPALRTRRAGLAKAFVAPVWPCGESPRIELEFRLHGLQWKLTDYRPLKSSS